MSDDPRDPSSTDSASEAATAADGAGEALAGADAGPGEQLGGWGTDREQETWIEIDSAAVELGSERGGDGDATGTADEAARTRRPTAYGLPPITEHSSNLRSRIEGSLTTRAPEPLRADPAPADEPAVSAAWRRTEPTSLRSPRSWSLPSLGGLGRGRLGGGGLGENWLSDGRLGGLSGEHPELLIAAGFAIGLVLATICKRLAR